MEKLSYLCKLPGIGGQMKETPADFEVGELVSQPAMAPSGQYAYFTIRKEGKSTQEALDAIASALGVPSSRFSCGGQKDRQAKTTQLASGYGISRQAIENAHLPPSVSIEFVGFGNSQVKIGALLGNRFAIRVNGGKSKNPESAVAAIYDELEGVFPNYFGEQRFGMRGNNHIVGKLLVQGKTEDAAMEYLCGHGEGNPASADARKRLFDEREFSAALSYFPQNLNYERNMLNALSEKPHDFVRAFLCLPRPILLLFVHAYQSHLFNLHLSTRVEEGEIAPENAQDGEKVQGSMGAYGFPNEKSSVGKKWLALRLLGYESSPNEYEAALLEDDEIRIADFKVRQMPMLGSRGGWRCALSPLAEFEYAKNTFSFCLPSGSYATMAMREFIDAKNR